MPISRAAASVALIFLPLASGPPARAQDSLESLTKAVTAFKLSNGAQFFVVERPQSPLTAFHLRVKAGIADEPQGRGGLAGVALLTFREGSETLGSHNPAGEKTALAEASQSLEVVRTEQAKGDAVDDLKKGRAEYQAREAFERAARFALGQRYFEGVLTAAGASNMELRPSADYSDLALTLPSHRAELWFRMVSAWLQAPTGRSFPQNRDRVIEQREQAGKTGQFQRERALGSYFTLNPYRSLAAGDTELTWTGPEDVLSFVQANYIPANLTVAIVGDIGSAEARKWAEAYFGKLPGTEPPSPKQAEDVKLTSSPSPIQLAVRENPVFTIAWPRPAQTDPSNRVFEVLQAALAAGAGAPLYDELLTVSRVASRLSITSPYPGGRFPGLFLIDADPLPNASHADVEAAILRAIDSVARNGVTDADLARARRWWRNRLLSEALTANGRAGQLVRLHTEAGTYKVDEHLAALGAVTAADCKKVVATYFAAQPHLTIHQLLAVPGAEGQ